MEDVRESQRLVRMYSFDVEERLPPPNGAHQLGSVLSREKGDLDALTAPWRKFFEPWDQGDGNERAITRVIDVESKKLREQWLVFEQQSPHDERLDLNCDEPTVQGIVNMVEGMRRAWAAKRSKGFMGKTLDQFHRFCHTLNSHSALIAVLPEGNEYVSLFTGSLNAIIKASVNHEKIAEGLAQALWQISEHIAECDTKRDLFPTQQMQSEVAKFYSQIFIFLSDIMGWMTRKRRERFMDSFKEDFNKRFEDQVESITVISKKMRTLAALGTSAEQRVVRLNIEKIGSEIQDIRTGLEGDSRDHAEQLIRMERLERELSDLKAAVRDEGHNFKQLASDLQLFLQGQALQYISGQPPEHRYLPPPSPQPIAQSLFPTGTPPKQTPWTPETVSLHSSDLEDFFHRNRVRLYPDTDLGPITESLTTSARLSSWLTSDASSTLWLAGPDVAADAFANPVTVLATQLLRLADTRGIPTLSYFCELRRGERLRTGNVSREAQAAVALVCALIRQAVELLPPPPLQRPAADETDEAPAVDLSEQRFRQVDGTVLAWDEAVGVLRDVLGLLPRTVVCVVDGMQWLDDSSTAVYLGELVKALRRQERVKVLFTTAGRSKCLLRELDASEVLGFECGDGAGMLA